LQTITKIQGRYYLAIFVLASVTFSYQILTTRFFSVMLYYHFLPFCIRCHAMPGLTRGAMQAQLNVTLPDGLAWNSPAMLRGSRSAAWAP
jgi:hypothetical protein